MPDSTTRSMCSSGARLAVELDVLAHAAEADGIEDVWLALAREVDGLRIAAALDVEDATRAPAVLVVADEQARGVGGKRRLAGAGKAEEDARLAGGGVDVGAAVHGQHAVLERQEVVHHREDGLLDLAAVAGASDNDLLAVHIEDDRRGLEAVAIARAHVGGRREHGDVRTAEHVELVLRGTHEHVLNEERLVRALADDHDLTGVLTIRTREAADHEQVAALRHVTRHVLAHALVRLLVDRLVRLAIPIHLLIGLAGVHDVAVLGATAGEGTGRNGKRPRRGQVRLVVRHGMLDELRWAPIHVHAVDIAVDTVLQKYGFDHALHTFLYASADLER